MSKLSRRVLVARTGAALLTIVVCVLLLAGNGKAQRARSAADATVFIRLVGSVQAAIEGTLETMRWDQVEIGSGSGFVISPDGYVLTNHHVIGTDDLRYAVGVIRLKVTDADGIGFAVPINRVKTFLEANGLDRALPVRRLHLGPMQGLDGKGIRMRLPEGFTDTSPFRSHVETEEKPGDIALRIDRVFSPLTSQQLHQVLVAKDVFERLSLTASELESAPQPDGHRVLLGHATGSTPDGKREIRMVTAVLDLGAEKIVARYVGPAEQIAFNESIVRESLAGLTAEPLLTEELVIEKLNWLARPESPVPIPADWIVESGGPSRCTGLPAPSAAVSTFARGDFTIVLRVAAWSAGEFGLERAASACSTRRGTLDGSSYAAAVDWLGVSYAIEGVFTRIGTRHVQLEVLSPVRKSALARALLTASLKRAAE